ncbi:translation initiation factor IF-2-like [Cervus canadensis]|uniref:translation initiation factor IF-2-like n=1 Tax=Cervus canadensis TaxID=1574408 RepID=UPI001CA3301F|nr:translation initiation factor IF-2-like [Cervus canadensis]
MEERVAGVHPGQFPPPLLRGSSTFPTVLYVSQTRPGASSPTRMTPGAASSPGIGNFVTFPDYASPRAGEYCKGPSRKCDPGLRRKRPAHRGPGTRHATCPPGGPGCLPSPSPVSETHHRLRPARGRSPAPGMCADAVGPRAGFRARVGERRALASPAPGTGRVVAASAPAARRIPRGDHSQPPALPPAGQRSPAGDRPVLARTSPGVTRGRGGPTVAGIPTLRLEVGALSPRPVTCVETPSAYFGQENRAPSTPRVLLLPAPNSLEPRSLQPQVS